MNPAAVDALASLAAQGQTSPMSSAAAPMPELGPSGAADAAGSFGHMVNSGIDAVNGQLLNSETDLQRLAVGTAPSLHRVMMGLEETRLSFQLLVQIRNRVLEAYQDVMKMQV